MKVREVIRALEQDGWRVDRQRGSHRIFRHGTKPDKLPAHEPLPPKNRLRRPFVQKLGQLVLVRDNALAPGMLIRLPLSLDEDGKLK